MATPAALTEHGETLDALCWRVLGNTSQVEAVYAANPGLAALGTILPAGVEIVIPAAATTPAAPTRETIQLWS